MPLSECPLGSEAYPILRCLEVACKPPVDLSTLQLFLLRMTDANFARVTRQRPCCRSSRIKLRERPCQCSCVPRYRPAPPLPVTEKSSTGFPIVSTLLEQFLLKDIALLAAFVNASRQTEDQQGVSRAEFRRGAVKSRADRSCRRGCQLRAYLLACGTKTKCSARARHWP
jgi:hypothetical protein